MFEAPTWTIGPGTSFAITASAVAGRASAFSCPARVALGARSQAGSLQPRGAGAWRRTWDPAGRLWFGLMDALADQPPDERMTFTQRRFVLHAKEIFDDLGELASASAGVELTVAASVEHTGDGFRIYVTGPQLASADGDVREAVRLRYRALRGPGSEEAQDFIAVSALVLAHGCAADRLRISELSLDDGSYGLLWEGTPQEARALYAGRDRPVQQALASLELRPGSGCADCSFLPVCPGPAHVRGALGIAGRAVATRAITSTDVQVYALCPTRYQALRRDHLPERSPQAAGSDGEAQRRGLAVHAWLAWAHRRGRGCTAADLPEDGPGESGLAPEAYVLARPYLLQHVGQCLLGFDGLADVRCEPLHVVHDPDSDTVVVIAPDLTARFGPSEPLWRETKTTTGTPPRDAVEAIDRYPGAFALPVALLAAGVDGAGRDQGAVELEVLTQAEAHLYVVPLSDGALVALAQQRVAEIAHRWATDVRFERQPSLACASCGAHGWCDPPEQAQRPAVAPDDREFLGLPDPF